jgi:hypothetical protein
MDATATPAVAFFLMSRITLTSRQKACMLAHAVHASLDGQPATDHWQMSSGNHKLITAGQGQLYLVCTQAWDCGWRPSVHHG